MISETAGLIPRKSFVVDPRRSLLADDPSVSEDPDPGSGDDFDDGGSDDGGFDDGGFDDGGFERAFRERFLLSPAAFRALPGSATFEIALPPWLDTSSLLSYWGRDPKSLSEKVEGRTIRWATDSEVGPLRVDAKLGDDRAAVTVHGNADPFAAVHAHDLLIRWLGLHLDPRAFEQRVADGPHRALIEGRRGRTLPQTGTVFDGVLWVVAGQQVSLVSAFSVRRRLTEGFGTPIAGLVCPPSASAVVEAGVEALHRHGLTRRKAEYLWGVAGTAEPHPPRLPADRSPTPSLEGWRARDEQALEAHILSLRGLGAWSANYLLMRALGFPDRVPVGDVALERALKTFLGLDERPRGEGVLGPMAAFAPFRSLATYHLWAWSGAKAAE